MTKHSETPRYRVIYEALREAIVSGQYAPGSRLPSEVDLADVHQTSRITVARAFQELHMQGYVERRIGAGTYVRSPEAKQELRFGLLIPDLGRTEIFEPICQGMAAAQTGDTRFSLLWGNSEGPHGTSEAQINSLIQHFLQVGVSGVFFAPFELTRNHHEVNLSVISAFEKENIPVVLLDRDIEAYPNRSRQDVIGIDNRRAGYMLAQLLLDKGCRRIAFIARPGSAPTVDARIMGYRDALLQAGQIPEAQWTHYLNPMNAEELKKMMQEIRPEAIICANDVTSMMVMRSLNELGVQIPEDVLIGSFDDVKYAELLMVPLTTIHQPCEAIGKEAVAAMLERVKNPDLPARNILLDFHLIERESTRVEGDAQRAKRLKEMPIRTSRRV